MRNSHRAHPSTADEEGGIHESGETMRPQLGGAIVMMRGRVREFLCPGAERQTYISEPNPGILLR